MRVILPVLLLLVATTVSPSASALVLREQIPYYPKNFYQDLENGLNGDELRERLFEIIKVGQVNLGYQTARRVMFGRIHLQKTEQGYAIRDAYCQVTYTHKDFKSQPPGPDLIPDPKVVNTEHTWPQSRFSRRFSKGMQKSDLHILYPVNTRANTSRGNHPFAEVASDVQGPCPASRRGYSYDGNSEIYFEPPNEHKGDVARAIFYFATRYKLRISPIEERALRRWNHEDPVTDFERQRNDIVVRHQKNRNPFIDYPELIDEIQDF